MSSTTQKILRCLMLTQSDNDHEALAAIRKANQLLAVHNLNWEGYVGVALKLDQDAPKPPPPPRQERTYEYEQQSDADYSLQGMSYRDRTIKMFRIVKAKLEEEGSDALSFIHSLEDGFAKYGSLTERQYAALKRFYDNAKKARVPF